MATITYVCLACGLKYEIEEPKSAGTAYPDCFWHCVSKETCECDGTLVPVGFDNEVRLTKMGELVDIRKMVSVARVVQSKRLGHSQDLVTDGSYEKANSHYGRVFAEVYEAKADGVTKDTARVFVGFRDRSLFVILHKGDRYYLPKVGPNRYMTKWKSSVWMHEWWGEEADEYGSDWTEENVRFDPVV